MAMSSGIWSSDSMTPTRPTGRPSQNATASR